MPKVRTPSGELFRIPQLQGQLFICNGCCCGNSAEGNSPVPNEWLDAEWRRRRLTNKIHLTFTGCLGPCAVANVVMLQFAGHTHWFHSLTDDPHLWRSLFDYIEQALAQSSPTSLPPLPASLEQRRLARFEVQAS